MTVAVLMSVYNGEKYLQEQLESLASQDYKNWKLYIRDDGSSDGTADLVRNFAQNQNNVIFVDNQGENLGPASSFLKLLQEVTADCYMFCDQDDVWFPEKISAMVHQLNSAENFAADKPVLVISDAKVVDEDLNTVNTSFWKYSKFPPQLLQKNPEYINVFNAAPGCTMLFNDQLKKLLPFSEKEILMHDWLVIIYAMKYGKLIVEKRPLMLYRQHNFNAVGAERITLFNKLKMLIFRNAEQRERELRVFQFVSRFTGISKSQYYRMKAKFNIFRYFSA